MYVSTTASGGVKQISYDPGTGFTAVYHKAGQVDYYYGVAWNDIYTVATATYPENAVGTNLDSKYKKAAGGHG